MLKRKRISESVLKNVGANAKWRCQGCDELLQATFQLDHVKPIHLGGEDTIDNLQPLCVVCHAKKTQQERMNEMLERRAAIDKAKKALPSPQRTPVTLIVPRCRDEERANHSQFVANRFLLFAYTPTRKRP